MFECTADDIYHALQKAPNINAAVKNFLKKEVRKGDPSEKFAKSLRVAFASNNELQARQFVADAMPKFLNHLYSVACYAYFEFVTKLAEAIVGQYADEFNSTFEIVEDKVKYKDQEKFKEISSKALKIISDGLEEAGFSDSPFMKNVALISVFEKPVIDVLSPSIQ